MQIGIVGAGKLGCTLARALKDSGQEISGVYSRTAKSAAFLAKEVGGIFPNNLKITVEQAGVIFITVNDDLIEVLTNRIVSLFKRRAGKPLAGKAFFHCSGAKSSEILAPLKELGADMGSLHPLMTFPNKTMDIEDIMGISFCFDGDDSALKIAVELTDMMDTNLFSLPNPKDKPLYHIAACILSNYSTVLIDVAGEAFREIGVSPQEGIAHCLPLIYMSIENAMNLGPAPALTGPISRGDLTTVRSHLEIIKERTPWLSDLYRVLGLYAAAISIGDKRFGTEKYEQLQDLLESGVRDNE
ncbi:MAG: DUF2520 domain-containing protein [Bacillota bacterium]